MYYISYLSLYILAQKHFLLYLENWNIYFLETLNHTNILVESNVTITKNERTSGEKSIAI